MIYDLLKSELQKVDALTGRIYRLQAPERTEYPFCTMLLVSSQTGATLDGTDGLFESRYQFDFYDTNMSRNANTATQVIALLDGYQSSEMICNLDNQQDLSESNDGGRILNRISMDFIVWHN